MEYLERRRGEIVEWVIVEAKHGGSPQIAVKAGGIAAIDDLSRALFPLAEVKAAPEEEFIDPATIAQPGKKAKP